MSWIKSVGSEINKKYKKSMAAVPQSNAPIVPTGIFGLDVVLGGGLRVGTLWENRGLFSSGKSSVAMRIISQFQRTSRDTYKPLQKFDTQLMVPIGERLPGESMRCVYVDVEGHMDVNYAKALGVDMDNLLVVNSSTAEEIFDTVLDLVEGAEDGHSKVDFIVIDSIAEIMPEDEIEKEMGKDSRAVLARTLTKFFTKLKGRYHDHLCALKPGQVSHFPTMLFLNQMRDKQDAMYAGVKQSPGGRAIEHADTYRSLIKPVYDGVLFNFYGIPCAQKVTIDFDKNKVTGNKTGVTLTLASRYTETPEGSIIAAGGTNITEQLATIIKTYRYPEIEMTGTWYVYKGNKYQGAAKFGKFLLENPEERLELEEKVMKYVLDLQKDYNNADSKQKEVD